MTYTRLTTLQADPSKLEEGIRFFREQSLTTARQQQGFQRARRLIDRLIDAGRPLTQGAAE